MNLNPLDAIVELGLGVISSIWPDKTKQAEEARKLMELAQKGDLAKLTAHVTLLQGQMAINAKEAEHKSIFVAGWRSSVGWVCALGLLYASFIEPLLRFAATMYGYEGEFPVIDTSLTMQVLLGMLGLAGMRSFEKVKKVATHSLKK